MMHAGENLWRGPKPKRLEDLKKFGIKNIINLQSGFYKFANQSDRALEFPVDYGMNLFEIPLSDFKIPNKGHVLAAIDVIKRGEPTYIHCLHGVDRTGYVCAVHRIRQMGWSVRMAEMEMIDRGFHLIPYFYWIRSLKGYVK